MVLALFNMWKPFSHMEFLFFIFSTLRLGAIKLEIRIFVSEFPYVEHSVCDNQVRNPNSSKNREFSLNFDNLF